MVVLNLVSLKPVPSCVVGPAPGSRNPQRTRERILQAAFKEFAGNGFDGARVDRIARGAGINKRMLYHYFGDKKGLFREVLRRKMAERQAWGEVTPNEPSESLPYWFELASRDLDWIRLLEWEALQSVDERLIDEGRRQKAVAGALERIRARQKLGYLNQDLSAQHTLLAMTALTWFPLAFPQLTRLITGESVFDEKFRKQQKAFLKAFATAFESRKSPGRNESNRNRNVERGLS